MLGQLSNGTNSAYQTTMRVFDEIYWAKQALDHAFKYLVLPIADNNMNRQLLKNDVWQSVSGVDDNALSSTNEPTQN